MKSTDLGATLRRLQRSASIIANGFMVLVALVHDNRYWVDVDKNIRRTPGKKPLLHNGGKPK